MSTLRTALEAALVENPDDLVAHMAYGDLLAEQGDPRGEFIQVQLALEDPSRSPEQRKELETREKALLKNHLETWLGPLRPMFGATRKNPPFGLEYFRPDRCTYLFTRGWLEAMTLDYITPEIVEALIACPTARLLREFGFARNEHENAAIESLAKLPFLDALRKFRIGPDDDQCHITGTGIAPALAKMKRLEELYLYAHRVELNEVFAQPMPHLRVLHADHMHEYPLEVLAANPTLGNLVTIHCHPHGLEPGDLEAYITAEGFIALVNSPHLKSLANLHLYLTDIGDRGVASLVESGLLKQLRVLDLWSGCITDEGARTLAACPDLPRLQKLILSQNALTTAGIEALRATGVNLEAENQYDPDGLYDEHEYLWEGDCE